jgi:hypothetical protein
LKANFGHIVFASVHTTTNFNRNFALLYCGYSVVKRSNSTAPGGAARNSKLQVSVPGQAVIRNTVIALGYKIEFQFLVKERKIFLFT